MYLGSRGIIGGLDCLCCLGVHQGHGLAFSTRYRIRQLVVSRFRHFLSKGEYRCISSVLFLFPSSYPPISRLGFPLYCCRRPSNFCLVDLTTVLCSSSVCLSPLTLFRSFLPPTLSSFLYCIDSSLLPSSPTLVHSYPFSFPLDALHPLV